MTKCRVESCQGQAPDDKHVGLCEGHWERWGPFMAGWQCGSGQPIRLPTKRSRGTWDDCFNAYLEWAERDLRGLVALAEGLRSGKGLE